MVARTPETKSVAYVRVKILTFLVLWIFIVSTIFITWQYTAFEVIEGEPTNKYVAHCFIFLFIIPTTHIIGHGYSYYF